MYIRNLGVAVAIDDFGTGYSSLSYLTQFPMDILKIDRSFIQLAMQGKRSKAILETMVNMGHALNMRVDCEGAETVAQRSMLEEIGADVMQGFVDGRPMDLFDALALFQQDKRKNLRLASN